jgi:hypothetical protein
MYAADGEMSHDLRNFGELLALLAGAIICQLQ